MKNYKYRQQCGQRAAGFPAGYSLLVQLCPQVQVTVVVPSAGFGVCACVCVCVPGFVSPLPCMVGCFPLRTIEAGFYTAAVQDPGERYYVQGVTALD